MSNADNDASRRSIIEMSSDEAKAFFLKHESYSTIELPEYFQFSRLLDAVDQLLHKKPLPGLTKRRPHEFEGVNYQILNNKDGRYAWRPLELIHPALYVALVVEITDSNNWDYIVEQFVNFGSDPRVQCLSLPVESLSREKDRAEQVSSWWETVEQRSIELSLDFGFILHTDITDCYSSIYTHSIPWALHSKDVAKSERRRDVLIGNTIDSGIRDMRNGQTNGIPQGSVLMDFIAEMVLGYADTILSKKVEDEGVTDYTILRYRDDYRIFVNNPQDGERILKCLTESLIGLGLKLNPEKTRVTSAVISGSLKIDKIDWMLGKRSDRNLQRHLLIIHDHSVHHPNTGSLVRALNYYYQRLIKVKNYRSPLPLISIIADIAFRNPITYPVSAAILSKLISFLEYDWERQEVVEKVLGKFSNIPNTGHMQVWLQRISCHFDRDVEFNEPLCQIIHQNHENIWNNEWISSNDLRNIVNSNRLIDFSILNDMDPVIPIKEIELYKSRYA